MVSRILSRMLLAIAACAAAQSGTTVRDLQIAVTLSVSSRGAQGEICIVLRNGSPRELSVPFGLLPGGAGLQPFQNLEHNGAPLLVHFFVSGEDGVTRRVHYIGANQLAGYTEPWVIRIPTGQNRRICVPISEYRLSGSESLMEFLKQSCRLHIKFEVPADACKGERFSCWSGKAVSNTLNIRTH